MSNHPAQFPRQVSPQWDGLANQDRADAERVRLEGLGMSPWPWRAQTAAEAHREAVEWAAFIRRGRSSLDRLPTPEFCAAVEAVMDSEEVTALVERQTLHA